MARKDREPGFRTAVERLTTVLKDETAATVLIERLRHDGLRVDAEQIRPLPSGYTGARLGVVTLRRIYGKPRPRPCVIKLCPPGPFGREPENQAHHAALDEAPPKFKRRLLGVAFSPVFCDGDRVITGQKFADGRPLSSLQPEE